MIKNNFNVKYMVKTFQTLTKLLYASNVFYNPGTLFTFTTFATLWKSKKAFGKY